MCDHMGNFYVCPAYICVACSAKRKGLGEAQQVVIGPLWGAMTYACDDEWEKFVSLCEPTYVTVKQGKSN